VNASIGIRFLLKGLIEAGSQLGSKMTVETNWVKEVEDEIEISGSAPKCGKRDVRYYQYYRMYHIKYQDQRIYPFRKKPFDDTLIEWTNRGEELSTSTEYDAESKCGCREPDLPPRKNTRLGIKNLGKIYQYLETENGIELLDLGIVVPVKSINDLYKTEITVRSNIFPAYVRALAGIVDEEQVTISFSPFQEDWLNVIAPSVAKQRYFETEFSNSVLIEPPNKELASILFSIASSCLGITVFWFLTPKINNRNKYTKLIRLFLSIIGGAASTIIGSTLIDALITRMETRNRMNLIENEKVRLKRTIQMYSALSKEVDTYKESIDKLKEIIENYNRIINLDPQDASAYYNRGRVYSELGDHEQAIADLSKAIELDPKNALAYRDRICIPFSSKTL
jgi:tetratricopeptide (TPR) repeat protein